MADDPKGPPASPDQLGGGLKGRVSGVTRIGPRAFGIGAAIAGLVIILIFYGVTKKNAPPSSQPVALQSAPVAAPSDLPTYITEPTTATEVPTIEPYVLSTPAVAELATPGPQAAAPVVQATVSADDQAKIDAENAAAAKAAADEAARRKAQADALEAARRSRILTGQGVAQSGGANVDAGSGVQQLSFAGNDGQTNSAAAPGETASSGSYSGNGNASGSATYANSRGGGTTATNALLGRPVATDNFQNPSPAPADSTTFLNGPTNQYGHVQSSSNIILPSGGTAADFLQAQRFAPVSPFEITAGSVMPSELITGIDSELQGLISAQIREDVYDTKTGKYLLIPRGARLVGLYRSATGYGASRILVAWQRLIFPDTTSIDLQNMSGSDVEGGAGFGGDVDNHYGKIFGAALLTSVLAAGASLATPEQQVTTDGVISPTTQAASQISQNILNIGTQITNRALSIPPTIHVMRGYPFLVVVDRDIVLPGPYGRGL